MVWPFSRGRSKRLSEIAQPTADPEKDQKAFLPAHPQNATPRNPEESSLRKRRRSPDKALEADIRPEPRRHRSRNSVEDITALPGARRLERSPHLRRSSLHRAAIPYASHPVPASRIAAMRTQSVNDYGDKKPKPEPKPDTGAQKRRLSKRQEAHNRAIREEEIRAMSAPVPIPKRVSGHGDMLNRDNKKARRFSSKHNDDVRGSNVSLPFQESIHSSMSGASEQRAWEVHGLAFLSPRPNVRLSSSLPHSASFSGPYGLSRSGSKKEKLPALKEDVKKRDRRRVAELADDLGASDLRVLLERDQRRKEKKKLTDKEKLEAKLRRRAEDARRAPAVPPLPPTAVHPALREKTPAEEPSTIGQAPPTPTSVKEATKEPQQNLDIRQDSMAVDPSPFRDPSPTSEYSDPFKLGPPREDTPQSNVPTPMETPMDDPVVGTAHEIRYSQGRLSQIESNSPPASPIRGNYPRNMSPLRREYTPDLAPLATSTSSPLKQTESATTRKPGTWASIFRRGTTRTPDQSPPPPRAGTSFSNTSRDSMSKQPIPAHLIGNTSRRRSGTPARTQSIFREDLPESPASPPDSRVNSPDIIAAANVAASRRSRRGGSSAIAIPHARGATPESHRVARSVSPNDTDGRNSTLAMSASLASIDSEGSWLTGRPTKRKSNASHMRSSVGSARRAQSGNPSYEDLGMADEEYVRRLTPSPEDDVDGMDTEPTPIAEVESPEEATLLRRETSRRKPRMVYRDDAAKSREGLVADFHSGVTPLQRSPEESPDSLRESASELESDNDQVHDPSWEDKQHVVYGKGHARQLSAGSAKLLDIRPRSGRTTPDARMSIASGPDVQSPTIQSPRPASPTASSSKL